MTRALPQQTDGDEGGRIMAGARGDAAVPQPEWSAASCSPEAPPPRSGRLNWRRLQGPNLRSIARRLARVSLILRAAARPCASCGAPFNRRSEGRRAGHRGCRDRSGGRGISRRRACRRRARQHHRQAGVLGFPVWRHRRPFAARHRHLHGRRLADSGAGGAGTNSKPCCQRRSSSGRRRRKAGARR